MNVVIIEDEKLTAQRLKALIHKYSSGINILAELASVEESVQWFRENAASDLQPDLIFMDIHLEDGDSFQIVRETNLKTPIIFTTAFDEYMIKAFKVNSIDYLLKPISFEELSSAIDKYKSLKATFTGPANTSDTADHTLDRLLESLGRAGSASAFKDRFMITIGTKIRTVKTADIAYFFLEQKAVYLTTFDNVTLPSDYSLDKIIQLVDPRNFFRINRQFITSLDAIQLVHTYSAGKLKLDLKPKPRQETFVSGDRISEFKEWLGK
jgi:two-component system LytT family response regulator